MLVARQRNRTLLAVDKETEFQRLLLGLPD